MAGAGAAAGNGFAGNGNQISSMEDNVSFDQMESSDPCGCSDGHHHNQNKPKIVKKLNRLINCSVIEIGPDEPEIFPKPPKKKRKDCY